MRRELQAVFDVLVHGGFIAGLACGLIGAALLFVVGRMTSRPPFGWGMVLTAATVAGLGTQFELGAALLWRLAILMGVGLLIDVVSHADAHPSVTIGAWALAGLFASMVLGREPSWPPWIDLAFPFVVIGLALGIREWGHHPRSESAGPMFAITVVGAWVTVPETDMVAVILGAAIPLGLVTLRPIRARVTAAGALGLSVVYVWLALVAGAPRPWTIVAAWAAAAAIPLVALLLSRLGKRPRQSAVLLAHVIYVFSITRVADHTESVLVVLAVSVALIALTGMALLPPALREAPDRSHPRSESAGV